eukprot:Seg898.4 transcript_id=Seg898.4/GoldUCD/mRNA.D3Y31 product="Tyrocidine synthase 2" protein_id=Seg898.4/GoldUCD/D3Y31
MDSESRCLNVQFVDQAKKSPEKIAIVSHDGRTTSYAQLERATSTLAESLRQRGCQRDSVVGIYTQRSLEYAIAYVSILKAGGAYLPMELSYPQPLLQSVLDDARPVAIVTTKENKENLPSGFEIISLEGKWEKKLNEENSLYKKELPPVNTQLDDLAYVVYSSGTTGKPKGMQYYVSQKTTI